MVSLPYFFTEQHSSRKPSYKMSRFVMSVYQLRVRVHITFNLLKTPLEDDLQTDLLRDMFTIQGLACTPSL